MSKLYYNRTTNEYGVSFEMLRRKYPNASLLENLDQIDEWFSYETVDRPFVYRYQQISEGLPSFTESTNDQQQPILIDGLQTWVVTNKTTTPELIDSLRTELKTKVTDKRWETESGGITFINGIKIKTSKDDQDRILSVIINAERNGITEIDFKAESGWAKISIFALRQLAKELTNFVQFCFKTEKTHHDNIDTISDVEELCNYDYAANWVYSSNLNGTSKLNIYNLSVSDATTLLYSNFIFPNIINNEFFVLEGMLEDAQMLLDKNYYQVEDITPSQFYYLLATTGLDDAIDVLLPPLRIENIAKYSRYKSYLQGARFYEFSKAYALYLDIKPKILVVNPLLDYSLEQLKTLWLEASTI